MTWHIALVSAIVMSLSLPVTPVAAQGRSDPACNDKSAPNPHVKFRHLTDRGDRYYVISVRPGDTIVVCIDETALDHFTYAIAGVTKGSDAATQSVNVEKGSLRTRRLTRPHDEQFGGYLVSIRRMVPAPVVVTENGAKIGELDDVTLMIAVTSEQFNFEFAGAFTINNLADPQYALESRMVDGQTKTFVVGDESAEDSARLGLGAFVHVFHHRLPWLAATFGIGIAESNRTSYFAGPSLRLGKAMAITAGPVWGSVKRLPSGVRVDSEVRNENALNDLPMQVKRGWFFGVSYSFLQARQGIEKPFAPVDKR